MELKKNPQYQLHKHRPLFFTIGLVIALLCVLVAFEWKAPYDPVDIRSGEDTFEPVELIMPTKFPEPKPPQPKKAIALKQSYEIKTDVATTDLAPIADFDEPIEDIPISLEAPVDVVEKTHIIVESMPIFEGGWEAFYEYVGQHINYPKKAKKAGVEGQVILEFVIDTDGTVTNVKVIKGIGFGCDEEAIRVLEKAPSFTPGKQRGQPVKVRQTLPIFFHLR